MASMASHTLRHASGSAPVIPGEARCIRAFRSCNSHGFWIRRGPVDFALIDGWPLRSGPSLARQVIEIVPPELRVGGFLMNDNGDPDYVEFIRDPSNGFLSVRLPIKGVRNSRSKYSDLRLFVKSLQSIRFAPLYRGRRDVYICTHASRLAQKQPVILHGTHSLQGNDHEQAHR